jgi:hypothetical protein
MTSHEETERLRAVVSATRRPHALVSTSAREVFGRRTIWPCRHDWPLGLFCQGGDGYVGGVAFFEAFPRDPDTFLRGEGPTVEDAEDACWARYVRIRECSGHELVQDGVSPHGTCRHCGLWQANVFQPKTCCVRCGVSTDWLSDRLGRYWCPDHADEIPPGIRWSFQDMTRPFVLAAVIERLIPELDVEEHVRRRLANYADAHTRVRVSPS